MFFHGVSSAPASASQRGSLGRALLAGAGAAVAGAVVWALIAYLTNRQFSLIAVLVGLAVGYEVHRFRPGDVTAAAGGAGLALLGCALGTFLGLVFVALGAGAGLGTILGHLNIIMHAYPHSVGLLGAFFWLIAAGIGFRCAMGGPLGWAARGGPRGRPASGSYGDPGPSFRPPAAAPYPAAQPPPGQPDPSPYAAPLPPTDPYGLPPSGQPDPGLYAAPLPPADPYGPPPPAGQRGTSPRLARPGRGQHAADWPPGQPAPGQPASGPGFPLPRRARPAGRHSRRSGRPPA